MGEMNGKNFSGSYCSFCLTLLVLGYLTVSTFGWHHPTSDFHLKTRRYYKNPRNVPTEYCPRDEAKAAIQGRTCLRKCTSDEDCKSKRKKCFCDGACGQSCIKLERECGNPEPPEDLGHVHFTEKMFGSKATYSCPDGYRVIGMAERICQADGSWSGSGPPACKKNIFCTKPPVIEHARHNAPLEQTTFELETSLQYQCYAGYLTKGFARTKCFFYNGTAKWFGPDINCEAKSCSEPPEILNGQKEGPCYHYSCVINYVCQPGFELVGRGSIRCESDGSWKMNHGGNILHDLPTCVPVQCSPPENPPNGKALYSSLSYNSPLTYECKYGYMLVGGSSARRCGPDKKWTELEPQCKEIDCGSPGILSNGWLEGSRTTLHAVIVYNCLQGMIFEGETNRVVCGSDSKWSSPLPKCLEIDCGHPGFLSNGWLENIERGTGLGSSIIFRCYDGMILSGHTSTVCTIQGTWSYPLAKCFAPCSIPAVPYGNVSTIPDNAAELEARNETVRPIILKPGSILAHGKVIGVECEDKYEATFNLTPSQCYNGTWTHAPRCQPARCKYLPKPPRYGMVIAPKTEHGMKARFACKDGFTLEGNNVTECLYGQWMGEAPVCNQTYCSFPGNIPNGRVLLVGNMGLYDYRNYVKKVANNRQIMFECDRGYILTEGKPQGKTCIRGEWSPKSEPPSCIPSQHPSFRWVRSVRSINRRVKRRAIKAGGGSLVRNKAVGGGGGSGPGRRGKKQKGRLGESEEFDFSPLICDDLDDPYIQAEVIKEGEEENITLSNGAMVKVSCSHGFGVNIPNDTLTCIKGRWKPKIPNCNALPCKTPFIFHGTLLEAGKALLFQEPVKHTKKIELKCSRGYELKGPKHLPCWFGEWAVNETPECIPVHCTLPQMDHLNYMGNFKAGLTVTHDTEVDYTCGGDYRKMVPGPSACVHGQWSPKILCLHPSVSYNYTEDEDIDLYDGIRKKGGKDGTRKFFGGGKGKFWTGHFVQNAAIFDLVTFCPGKLPQKETGAVSYMEGKPIEFNFSESFPEGTEITYRCVSMKPKSKNRWKLVCEGGVWIGEPLLCDEANDESVMNLLNMINGPCSGFPRDQYTVAYFEDKRIEEEAAEYPTGSVITSRCIDIGKYQLHGTVHRKCVSGQWMGLSPKCDGLSQKNDYGLDKPPTILFRYHNGSITQSNDGKLFVYPGTTLYMECLWIRKFGTPAWEASNGRNYTVAWAREEDGRDPNLEFRISIFDATEDDSAIYTCTTPARHPHRIEVVVKPLVCEPLPDDNPDLEFSTYSVLLGTKVTFTCSTGAVVGPKEVVCQTSGNWSAPLPRCENVECADISLLPAMAPLAFSSVTQNGSISKNDSAPPKIKVFGRDVGGRATFSCPQGFSVIGNSDAVCLSNGSWSSPIPLCKEVECTEPNHPENGYINGNPPYRAGDLAQFECHSGFMMEGQPIVACQDNGIWSKSNTVKCLQSCTYPGTTIGGTISKVRFHYAISETVTFDCQDGYTLQGARLLTCQRNGKWSNSIPTCIPK